MTDQQSEGERLRLARMDIAQHLAEILPIAVRTGLQSEDALIAQFINAILLNQAYDLLETLRTTKPGA